MRFAENQYSNSTFLSKIDINCEAFEISNLISEQSSHCGSLQEDHLLHIPIEEECLLQIGSLCQGQREHRTRAGKCCFVNLELHQQYFSLIGAAMSVPEKVNDVPRSLSYSRRKAHSVRWLSSVFNVSPNAKQQKNRQCDGCACSIRFYYASPSCFSQRKAKTLWGRYARYSCMYNSENNNDKPSSDEPIKVIRECFVSEKTTRREHETHHGDQSSEIMKSIVAASYREIDIILS